MDPRYEELLKHVQRPGRYIGGEVNSIVKDWNSVSLKVALVFPDIYDIGMSHLGIRILYHILNSRPDILCERAFAPWVDMEALLREKKLPIITLENNRPLKEFDIIGFSLSHELSYTNVLNILQMSDIPLRSEERQGTRPLVIAGGPCAFNPEPMSAFIDLFLVGDGESAVLEIADCYLRGAGGEKPQKDRKGLLRELSKIEGAYVPSLYRAEYDGAAFRGLVPVEKDIRAVVSKRSEPDLEKCFYPVKQILPYVPLVHDRISLEIMRGCPHRCRFCQASTLYAPTRLRSKNTILNLSRETQKRTGQDEISLLSLSTADYPGITDVLTDMIEEFKPKEISISLPSLRIKKDIKSLPPLIRKIKKTGFTFAPEVGSEKMKRFINKKIDNEDLKKGAEIAFESGWKKIKLYFMIGFPGENNEDLDALIDTAVSIDRMSSGRKKNRSNVTMSVSSFIPKPHTPFQWEPMAARESLANKIGYIKRATWPRRITVNAHDVDMSILEGVISRGDRMLCDVIESAFLEGARFDNWGGSLRTDIWRKAFSGCGIDEANYLRARGREEPLPWEHIHPGIGKEELAKEGLLAHSQTRH